MILPLPRSLGRLVAGPWVLLLLLLMVTLGLRLYGLQWGLGDPEGIYHPDERQLIMVASRLDMPSSLDEFLDPAASPLNPRFFAYGSLPMYVLAAATGVLERLQETRLDLVDRAILGRVFSAVSDTTTVLLLFLLGRRLYNGRIAFLGAMLTAFTVLHIQLSHFYTVDVPLTTFILAALYFAARLMQEGRLRDGLLAGLFLGLAVATKAAAVPLALPVALAWVYSLRRETRASPEIPARRQEGKALAGLAATGGVAAVAFALAQPYALLDFQAFSRGVLEQAQMARGILDFPYTRQFASTAPYGFHIQQLGLWGMGLPLGIAAWGGFAFVAWRGLRERRPADLLLLSWVAVYFLFTAGLHVKFMRYMLPITPLLGLFAAVLLWEMRRWRWRCPLGLSPGDWAIAVTLALTFLYALAYINLYSQDHPASRMSRWILGQVPPGSVIAQEHWDEPIRGLPEAGYPVPLLPLYEPDNLSKVSRLARELQGADYLAIYSERLYVSTSRLEERYPITRRYYQLLFSGELGFEPVRVEVSYPNLLGLSLVNDTTRFLGLEAPPSVTRAASTPWQVDLGFAQESFVAYDHPKVILFQKVEERGEEEYRALLTPALLEPTLGLLLSEEQQTIQREGGTWAQIFPEESLANRFPVVVWYVAFQFLFLVCLPLGLLLFRPLADRGYLLIKTLALLLVAYLSWLLASTGSLPVSRGSVLLAVVLVGVVSAVVLAFRWREVGGFLRERWRFLLFSEALFLVAFLAFVWLRAANPDLWHPYRGGEKPMDFAYLNAVLRSSVMPPFDPWFAGGYINYYYFGQFVVATLIRLTGIFPEVAYNLAVPLLFAVTLGGAFCISYNLIELARRSWGWPAGSRGVVAAAVVGGLFVAVVGNLDGPIQWGQGVWEGGRYIRAALLPGGGMPGLGDLGSSIGESGLTGLALWTQEAGRGVVDVGRQTWEAWRADLLFPPFDFWRSSRMVPGLHITEFPFFTFLFADLHAHMIGLPFTLVALGLALALALRLGHRGLSSLPGVGTTIVALGLVLGILWATNAWDYPTYLALSAGAVGLALYLRGTSLWRAALATAGAGLLFHLLSLLLLQPYHASFQTFYTGLRESPAQTNPLNYLAIHGLFLYILVTVLVLEISGRARSPTQRADLWIAALFFLAVDLAAAAVLALFYWLQSYLAIPLPALSVAVLYLVIPLLVLLQAVLYLVLRGGGPFPHRFALSMVALALALGVGVEVVAVKGDIERMNTLFKFYLQAWVLFGIASGYLLWYLGQRGLFQGLRQSRGKRLWFSGLLALLAAVVIYPLAAPGERLRDRFTPLPLTLDGMAYMQEAVYRDVEGEITLRWDAEAIDWLRRNVEGSPVIVEGVTPEYRWSGRVSIYTGLPTILGWNWHQRQQRGTYSGEVWERQREVLRLYSTPSPDEALEVLERYDVEYLYVGEMERLYYPEAGVTKFDEMVGEHLEVAYRNPGVTIYRLLPGEAS